MRGLPLAAVVVLGLLAGPAFAQTGGEEIVAYTPPAGLSVAVPPPFPPQETPPVCSDGSVSIPGQYDWNGAWSWTPAACAPARPDAVWIPPAYQNGVFNRGYWGTAAALDYYHKHYGSGWGGYYKRYYYSLCGGYIPGYGSYKYVAVYPLGTVPQTYVGGGSVPVGVSRGGGYVPVGRGVVSAPLSPSRGGGYTPAYRAPAPSYRISTPTYQASTSGYAQQQARQREQQQARQQSAGYAQQQARQREQNSYAQQQARQREQQDRQRYQQQATQRTQFNNRVVDQARNNYSEQRRYESQRYESQRRYSPPPRPSYTPPPRPSYTPPPRPSYSPPAYRPPPPVYNSYRRR